MRAFVRSVTCVVEVLQFSFVKEFAPKLADGVFDRLRAITEDELKTVDRDGLYELVRGVEALLTAGEVKGVAERVERLQLDLVLRLLQSRLLEKRINGMNELRATLERVTRAEAPEYAQFRAAEARVVTSKLLLKWLADNGVADLVLGPSSHHELIKRAPTLLKFLARHNALENSQLELLWSSSIGKHEAQVRVAFATIAELAPELTEKHLDALYARIAALPLSQYNELALHFLKNFTIGAVRSTRGRKFYGLDVFWRLLQDGSGAANEMAEGARVVLVELLSSHDFITQRLQYMDKCMVCVRDGHSVPQALLVLRRVLEAFAASGLASLETLIRQQQDRFQLVATLVADLRRYNERARQLLAAAPSGARDPVLMGRHAHSQQLLTRLQFLDFALSHSDLTLDPDSVEALWTVFVSEAAMPNDREIFMQWLRDARDEVGALASALLRAC